MGGGAPAELDHRGGEGGARPPPVGRQTLRFRVEGSGFQASGFGVSGSGFTVYGLELMVKASGFGVLGLGFGMYPGWHSRRSSRHVSHKVTASRAKRKQSEGC